MKKSILTVAVLLGVSISQASTISENTEGLYQGEEQVNEHPTGRSCYLYIDYAEVNPFGTHCYNLTTRPVFSTDRDSHPKDEVVVQGHVTNYHRPEYPKVKTCAMNMDGTNWLACTRFISDMSTPATIYPLSNMRNIKDLVPDQTHLFAQYEMIEPWLPTGSPDPERERLQSPDDRGRLDGYCECILCFCCTSGCPSHWWNGDRVPWSRRAPAGPSLADRQPRRGNWRSGRTGISFPGLPVPHHPQLHADLSEGPEPRAGDRGGQEDDRGTEQLR